MSDEAKMTVEGMLAEGFPVYGPVSEAAIVEPEATLGLRFPKGYRLFIKLYGAALFGDVTLFGIRPDGEPVDETMDYFFSSVVDQTISSRPAWYDEEAFPENGILFATNQDGVDFYFEVPQDGEADAPVYVRFEITPPQLLADSFEEMIRKLWQQPLYELVDLDGHGIPPVPPGPAVASAVNETGMAVSSRILSWIQLVPDPCPPGLSVLAQHFGVDEKTRDVFVYAKSTELDLQEQPAAFEVEAAVFASPPGEGTTGHVHVSLDHLIANHPELPQAFLFPQLKQVVLDAHRGK